jgi:hypothetical protein
MAISRLFVFIAILSLMGVYASYMGMEELDYPEMSLAETEEEFDLDDEDEGANQEEQDEEEEDFSFISDAPAPAPPTPLVVPNATATATTTYPNTPKPDTPCGCYNSGVCKGNVCICSPNWSGQWCERPSDLFLAREDQMHKLQNLTETTVNIANKLTEMEAVAGSPNAVQNLISEAARKEVARLNLNHACALFDQAVNRNDLFTARNQMNLVKFIDAERYVELQRQYVLAEQRINNQFNATAYSVKQFTVPVTHEYMYDGIDTSAAKSTDLRGFVRSKLAMDESLEQSKQFNLDFGDPV